jgi:hypothetical protein
LVGGLGEVVEQGVKQGAKQLTTQTAKQELGWVTRNARPVNDMASWLVHKQLSKVSTRAEAWVSRQAERLGFNVCFAAGTLMDTEWGWRKIEEIVAGEKLWSQDEFDVNGVSVLKVVEAVFVSEGLLTRLRVNGRDILTTAEHPFNEWERGWTPCNELKVGDRLRTRGGGWVTVEAVEETGEWATLTCAKSLSSRTTRISGRSKLRDRGPDVRKSEVLRPEARTRNTSPAPRRVRVRFTASDDSELSLSCDCQRSGHAAAR